MTEKMTGAQAKEMRAALTDELEETINRWHFLSNGLKWADDLHIRMLIERLVDAQPALDEGTAKEIATIVVKLHGLYGKAESLAFSLEEQAAGLERLLKRIQEVG